MIVVRSSDFFLTSKPSVITVGTFDGVHLGHQKIFYDVLKKSNEINGISVFITFLQHPKEILLEKENIFLLNTLEEKIEEFRKNLPDIVLLLNFDLEFSKLSAYDFYKKYILSNFNVKNVFEGADHMFGNNRESGIEDLKKIGKQNGFDVNLVSTVSIDDIKISSSKIRNFILNGEIETANKCLGKNYRLTGIVVKGDGRGKGNGFPTTNLKINSDKKILPKNGVYFVIVLIDEKKYYGMANIGTRPTFYNNNNLPLLEVHIFDLENDLYEKKISIEFLKYIREEKKFLNSENLKNQLFLDKEKCFSFINN